MNSELRGDIAALATAVVWSASVILFRLSAQPNSALAITFFKGSIGTVLFISGLMVTGQSFINISLTTNENLRLLGSSILGVSLGELFYFEALKRLSASFQAIVDCSYIIFLSGLAFLFFGESLSGMRWVGAALILGALALGNTERGNAKTQISGILFGMGAQLSTAVGILMIYDLMKRLDNLWVTSVRFITGYMVLFVYIVMFKRKTDVWSGFRWSRVLVYTVPASCLGTFFSSQLWIYGYRNTLATKAALLNQLSTLIIFIMAAVVLGEDMTRRRLVAILLGFSGAAVMILF